MSPRRAPHILLDTKALIPIVITASSIWSAEAGPIRDMILKNPERLETIIKDSSYKDLLTFINNGYAESQGETDGLTQYAYTAALAMASADKQVDLALDFSLTKPDLSLKASGATVIIDAVLSGTAMSSTQRDRAGAELKSELQALSSKGQSSFYFAYKAAEALIVLNDDAGLDVFLTDAETVRNYSLKDRWTPTSAATLFQQLQDAYTRQAKTSDKDWDKIMAATYGLCRARRAQGIGVNPIHPLVNLDNLLQ
jgi:hypothetical protein